MARRSYGTGSLYIKTDAAGSEHWYGRWYVGADRAKRKIGPKRQSGTREGLTRPQAEAELRRVMATEQPAENMPAMTVEEVADHMVRHLEALGRKPTTIETYRSTLRAQIVPALGGEEVAKVTTRAIERFV